MAKSAEFRFYEELNDFLPKERRKTAFRHEFTGSPSVKDAIESLGVPHTEIDLILVNGVSVTFSYRLSDGDRVAVYPVFESMNISNITRLRARPLRDPKFIVDAHLGKLAARLRMLGFDTLYDRTSCKEDIVRTAVSQKRIILTRNVSLLKFGAVTHGYWIRSDDPFGQVVETVRRFDLASALRPLARCMACNGVIVEVPKESVLDLLQPKTRQYYTEFFQCETCKKVYWKGSHHTGIEDFVEKVLAACRE